MMTIFSRFNFNYFFATSPETQIIWFWFACFAVLLAITVIVYIIFRAKAVSEKPYRQYAKSFLWPNLTLAIVGLILTFSRYERLALFTYRFWVYATILVVVTFNAWFFILKRSQLEDELVKFHNNERKEKWMNISNNKKHKTNK